MKKSTKLLATAICVAMCSASVTVVPVSASEETKLNKAYVQRLYDYGNVLSKNYIDLFTQESTQLIIDGTAKAQACILADNTQQEVDEAVLAIESMFAKAKLKEADEDIVLFDEFYKIYV